MKLEDELTLNFWFKIILIRTNVKTTLKYLLKYQEVVEVGSDLLPASDLNRSKSGDSKHTTNFWLFFQAKSGKHYYFERVLDRMPENTVQLREDCGQMLHQLLYV